MMLLLRGCRAARPRPHIHLWAGCSFLPSRSGRGQGACSTMGEWCYGSGGQAQSRCCADTAFSKVANPRHGVPMLTVVASYVATTLDYLILRPKRFVEAVQADYGTKYLRVSVYLVCSLVVSAFVVLLVKILVGERGRSLEIGVSEQIIALSSGAMAVAGMLVYVIAAKLVAFLLALP